MPSPQLARRKPPRPVRPQEAPAPRMLGPADGAPLAEKPETHASRLRRAGLRQTMARLAILDVLHRTPQALDVVGIYRELVNQRRDVSLPTVYRVTAELEARGLALRHWAKRGEARYAAPDGCSTGPALRILCRKCGTILPVDDLDLGETMSRLAAAVSTVSKAEPLAFYVTCLDCA